MDGFRPVALDAGAKSVLGLLSMNSFDNDIEALPDSWWRCWTSVLICQGRAIIGVDITDVQPGKREGVLIRDFGVHTGWRLRPEVSPALPPIIPFGQRCS